MNVERLYAVALRVIDKVETAEIVPQMSAMHQALNALAQNAADPSAQQVLASSRTTLAVALDDSAMNDWTEADRQVLIDLGVEEWLGRSLLNRIEEVLTRNEITFVVARDEFAPLLEGVQGKLEALKNLAGAMGALGLTSDSDDDEYEVVVVIPRREVHNHLQDLADEFQELRMIFDQFQQLATGETAPVVVRQIASSDFSLFVVAAPAWAYALAKAIQVIVDTYNGVLDIRIKRDQLADSGVPDEVLEPLVDHANGVMAATLQALSEELKEEFRESVEHNEYRLNELGNGINFALNKLANRIDAGFTFDVRVPQSANTAGDADSEEDDAEIEESVEARYAGFIGDAAQKIRYFRSAPTRILELPEAADTNS